MTFCAICTDEIAGEVHREPLGRGNALVAVCDDCSTTKPPVGVEEDRGYYAVPDQACTNEAFFAAIARAEERLVSAPPSFNRARSHQLVARAPNTTVMRVARPKRFAHEDAYKLIADRPWFDDARYIGFTEQFVVYELPEAT